MPYSLNALTLPLLSHVGLDFDPPRPRRPLQWQTISGIPILRATEVLNLEPGVACNLNLNPDWRPGNIELLNWTQFFLDRKFKWNNEMRKVKPSPKLYSKP